MLGNWKNTVPLHPFIHSCTKIRKIGSTKSFCIQGNSRLEQGHESIWYDLRRDDM